MCLYVKSLYPSSLQFAGQNVDLGVQVGDLDRVELMWREAEQGDKHNNIIQLFQMVNNVLNILCVCEVCACVYDLIMRSNWEMNLFSIYFSKIPFSMGFKKIWVQSVKYVHLTMIVLIYFSNIQLLKAPHKKKSIMYFGTQANWNTVTK